MILKHNILLLLILLIVSCNIDQKYTPENLRKLTNEELIQAAKQNIHFDYSKNIAKDESGKIIPKDSIYKLAYPCLMEWTFDKYVNEKNEIIESIMRKSTQKDFELNAQVTLALEEEPIIDFIDIDCSYIGELLDSIYILDQEMRQDGNSIDEKVETQCLNTVISIIKKCGMPTLQEVNQHQLTTIWLVFQHTHHNIRKEYFPLLEESAKNGNIKKSQIALTKDRILMFEGKPQIYGSQISQGCKTKWKLYRLQNPETVNKRRAEVGMKPMEEYLSFWDIEFKVKQKK